MRHSLLRFLSWKIFGQRAGSRRPELVDGGRVTTMPDCGQQVRRPCCNRTRGNGLKLKEGRFRLDRRKKLLH